MIINTFCSQGIRAVDCREPKIPYDQFINEVANKYIDIQHDYVEYTKHLQNVETQSHEPTGAAAAAAAATSTSSSSANNRTRKNNIFSFLANPFFLVLAKKNLGLYYDNKIKMMRERRNNIMMSLIEGRMPTPYFKIRLTRQNLLSEALSLIELQEQENPATLRKQLFVEFENEQGIDQGGVSKEFFQLAIDELLNKGFSTKLISFFNNLKIIKLLIFKIFNFPTTYFLNRFYLFKKFK
jgi:ubiquitin-protein ligase E3 A